MPDSRTKREVLDLIAAVAEKHPNWLADMTFAMQRGVQARLEQTLSDSADVETGLVDLLNHGRPGFTRDAKDIPESRLFLLRRAVQGLRTVKGTTFQAKWLEKLKDK